MLLHPRFRNSAVFRIRVDAMIPSSKLDRRNATRGNTTERRDDLFSWIGQGMNQPSHDRYRLLRGMLLEVVTAVVHLGNRCDVAVKILKLGSPGLLR